MSLKDEQKDALLGLVSGLGTPATEQTAIELARDNEEAAGFVQDMRLITRELRAFSEVPASLPLSSVQVDRLARDIVTRFNASRPRPLTQPRKPLRRWGVPIGAFSSLAVLACCLAIIFWSGRREDFDPNAVGQVLLIPGGTYAGEQSSHLFPASPGKLVRTTSGTARIRLTEQTTVVLGRNSVARLGGKEEPVLLEEGNLYVWSQEPTAIGSPEGRFELSSGLAELRITPETVSWLVYEGSGVLHAGSQSYQATPTRRILRQRPNGPVEMLNQEPRSVPAWAQKAFQGYSP